MMKYAVSLLSLLLLVGCESPGKLYLANDAAKVVITNHLNPILAGKIYGSNEFRLNTFPNSADCSGGTTYFPEIGADMPKAPATSAPISLEPNKDQAMKFYGNYYTAGKQYYCFVLVSFVPKAKTEYEMVFENDNGACYVRLFQNVNGKKVQDLSLKGRKFLPRTNPLSSAPQCEKL